MLPFAPGILQDGELALVARREIDVAAFTAQRDEAVRSWNQTRDTQPGAGAKHTDHRLGHRLAAGNLHAVFFLQTGQGHCQRGKAVDDQQGVQAEFAAHRFNRKTPVAVGHAHLVAVDRIGNGERRVMQLQVADLGQIGVHQRNDAGVFVAIEDVHRIEIAGTGLQSEARARGADIRQQARAA